MIEIMEDLAQFRPSSEFSRNTKSKKARLALVLARDTTRAWVDPRRVRGGAVRSTCSGTSTTERFAASCGLAGEPAAYFQQLVEFNQAKTAAERNRSYERLAGFRRYRQVQKLELAHAAYHSTWYLPAIRELCASPAFREDHEWLAGVLRPPIKANEAKNAVLTGEGKEFCSGRLSGQAGSGGAPCFARASLACLASSSFGIMVSSCCMVHSDSLANERMIAGCCMIETVPRAT